MISIDTNNLLPAVETGNAKHAPAAAFLESLQDREDVVISELILLELYPKRENAKLNRRAQRTQNKALP